MSKQERQERLEADRRRRAGLRKPADLTEFLAARLDEDEAAAKANIGAGLGETEEFGPSWPDYQTYSSADIKTAQNYISRFRPTRVLREVEAGRKILARYAEGLSSSWPLGDGDEEI